MQLCEPKVCVGCFACANICPQGAVLITLDDLGKTIPQIDHSRCIECGACQKACPVLSHVPLHKPCCAYAVWSKDQKDVVRSSSGGAAAVFSRYVIENGGVVCGSVVREGVTQHICIDNQDELDLLRGSKYVQSEIGDCYCQIRNYLSNGRMVLFIGTPCQSAGLQTFLGKDYAGLLTVDLICHGTPPQKYLTEYLLSQTKEFDSFSFRGKYDYYLTAYKGDEIVYQKERSQDLYYLSFLEGLIYRDNCYSCRYARTERASDLTIGDFWGLNRITMRQKYDGRISLVLPCTKKGQDFFETVKDSFFWEKRTISEAANETQGNLLHPSVPHKDRELFETIYRRNGFKKAVSSTSVKCSVVKNSIKGTRCYMFLRRIKKRLCTK